MKKVIINVLLLLLAVTSVQSCFKDLDIEQKSKITSSNMWLSESDATGAMYGMFHQFRAALNTAIIYWGDFRAGTFYHGAGSGTAGDKMFFNNLDGTESKGTNWGSLYTTINNANLILKHCEKISYLTEDTKKQVLAEAYFIRAYCYFTIARVWGDAPLLTSGFESDKEDLRPSRVDVNLLFAQVEADIEKALELMPESVTDPSIGTRSAVLMLKADHYLWKYQVRNGTEQDLQTAEDAVDQVLAGPHELLPSYADVFNINNKGNKEIIFTLRFAKGEYEGGYSSNWLIPTSRWVSDDSHIETDVKLMISDDQRYNFSPSMIEFLQSDFRDTRLPVCYRSWTDEVEGVTYSWVDKFAGLWEDNVRYFIADEPLYRYAEAILFKAEIENEQGNTASALTYLNKIAKRAYGVDNYYTTTDQEEFRSKLCDEYVKEFAAEGKTWWVYNRLGYIFTRVESLRGRQNETNILLWPISNSCMEENPNIRQTVGYY